MKTQQSTDGVLAWIHLGTQLSDREPLGGFARVWIRGLLKHTCLLSPLGLKGNRCHYWVCWFSSSPGTRWKKQLEDPNPSYLEGLQPTPGWIDPFGSQTSLPSSEVGAGRALGQSEGPGEPGLVGAQHHAAAGAGCAGELPRSLPRIRIGRRGTRALTENALCGRYKDRFLVFRGGGRGGSREI